MVKGNSFGSRFFDILNHLLLALAALAMFFPLIYVFAISFSTFEDVARGGIILFPKEWSFTAYRQVLTNPGVRNSMGISIFIATVGTLIQLAMTATMAYALSSKHLPFRRVFLIFVIIPILFWPGMIPRFLVVRDTGLLNTIWALIIPVAINSFNLIVMRNFFMSLPEELMESAEIDGANDLQIFWRLVIPLSKPILAAIGLFYAVANWNNYFGAILYIRDTSLWPIQVLLRSVVLQSQDQFSMLDTAAEMAPNYAVQMATVMIATIPILIIYPFLQRYFVKGVLTGAIKG